MDHLKPYDRATVGLWLRSHTQLVRETSGTVTWPPSATRGRRSTAGAGQTSDSCTDCRQTSRKLAD